MLRLLLCFVWYFFPLEYIYYNLIATQSQSMGKLAIVLSAFRSASQHGEVDDDDKKKAPLKYLIHSAKGS
jgi:hypothetical protein